MTTAAPLPLRAASVFLGTVLLVQAVRIGRQPAGSAHTTGRLVRCAAVVSRRHGWSRSRGGPDGLAVRLALAPRCWVARAVAVGARAGSGEPASSAPEFSASAVRLQLVDLAAGVRLLCAMAAACLCGCGMALVSLAAAPIGVMLGAVAGWTFPGLNLRCAARAALSGTNRHTALAVDLLAAALSAGMALRDSLELTATHAPPTTAAALRAAAVRLTTGSDPRTALAAEADRFHLPVLLDVGDAVDRHHRLGVPLAPELHRIAARQRADDRARVLEHAARRGPLATLIVAVVIAPVCLAALVACVVGGLVQTGGLGFH